MNTISEGCDAAAKHLPRCGRELYLRPATFTHSGYSSQPMIVPSLSLDELYWGDHGILAVHAVHMLKVDKATIVDPEKAVLRKPCLRLCHRAGRRQRPLRRMENEVMTAAFHPVERGRVDFMGRAAGIDLQVVPCPARCAGIRRSTCAG